MDTMLQERRPKKQKASLEPSEVVADERAQNLPCTARLSEPRRFCERALSVSNFQSELNVSRAIERAADLAKAVVLYAGVGLVEDMPVECVKQLAAEFGLHAFVNGYGLVDAEVLVVVREAAYVRRVARHVAEGPRAGTAIRAGVRIGECRAVPVARSA